MSFEIVVRPVVMPDIRPAPAQSRAPADDPTQGLATINGSSGQFLDLQYSWSASSSQSKPIEIKRRVDEARIYQMEDDGTINKDNFVDVRVAKKIWMKDAEVTVPHRYASMEPAENIEITKTDVMIMNKEELPSG